MEETKLGMAKWLKIPQKETEVSVKFKMLIKKRYDVMFENDMNQVKLIKKQAELQKLQEEIELLKVKTPQEEIDKLINIIDEDIKKSLEEVKDNDYNNESYMHKMAKNIVKSWFDDNYFEVTTTNRKSGVYLEYPVCEIDESDTIHVVWDEQGVDIDEFVPTYSQCVKLFDVTPICILDIAIIHKGTITFGIEICHTNPTPSWKIDKLKKLGLDKLIEIDASWVLNQVGPPKELKYKSLIGDGEVIKNRKL
jgi:hypothetical protein